MERISFEKRIPYDPVDWESTPVCVQKNGSSARIWCSWHHRKKPHEN